MTRESLEIEISNIENEEVAEAVIFNFVKIAMSLESTFVSKGCCLSERDSELFDFSKYQRVEREAFMAFYQKMTNIVVLKRRGVKLSDISQAINVCICEFCKKFPQIDYHLNKAESLKVK